MSLSALNILVVEDHPDTCAGLAMVTTILANAIDLGLTKMAECCPGLTYARLSWLPAWHLCEPYPTGT